MDLLKGWKVGLVKQLTSMMVGLSKPSLKIQNTQKVNVDKKYIQLIHLNYIKGDLGLMLLV